jgi:hypothetical protein
MTRSNKIINKFKIAGLIALLTAGGIIAGISYNKDSNSYDVQLKKEISHMSELQLQDAIKECDIAMERLQQIINADETNPEERFEARGAYRSISAHRAQFQERLDEIKGRQGTIINYNDIGRTR